MIKSWERILLPVSRHWNAILFALYLYRSFGSAVTAEAVPTMLVHTFRELTTKLFLFGRSFCLAFLYLTEV